MNEFVVRDSVALRSFSGSKLRTTREVLGELFPRERPQ